MWISRAKYQNLLLENARLRDEAGFLRGCVERAGENSRGVADAMERVVRAYVEVPNVPSPVGDVSDLIPMVGFDDEDWTDSLVQYRPPEPVNPAHLGLPDDYAVEFDDEVFEDGD